MMNESVEKDRAAKGYKVMKMKEVNTDCRSADLHHIRIAGDILNQMKDISFWIPFYICREN